MMEIGCLSNQEQAVELKFVFKQKLYLFYQSFSFTQVLGQDEYLLDADFISKLVIEGSNPKPNLTQIHQPFDPLQVQIEKLYQEQKPTFKKVSLIQFTKQKLELALKKLGYSQFLLMFYGSSVNGLLTNQNSDIDLTIIFLSNQEVDHQKILQKLQTQLIKNFSEVYNSFQLFPMKRMYLLRFKDAKMNIQIDLSINNKLGVLNSQLLFQYCLIDERYIKLCLYLKDMNKKNFPDERTRLTSYSFYMMLLVFLQGPIRGGKILPLLQDQSLNQFIHYEQQYNNYSYYDTASSQNSKSSNGKEGKFYYQSPHIKLNKLKTNIGMRSYEEFKETNQDWFIKNQNKKSEAEILREFLHILRKFPKTNYAFDVPRGKIVKKSEMTPLINQEQDKDNNPNIHPFFIKDPFDINHNLGRKIKFGSKMLDRYLEVFKQIENYGKKERVKE